VLQHIKLVNPCTIGTVQPVIRQVIEIIPN